MTAPVHRPRPRTPLTSFGPEVLAALIRGSRHTITLRTTYRRGVAFRKRLHELRATMRDEKHPLSEIVARAKVELEWGARAGLPEVPEHSSSRNVRYPRDPDTPAVLTIRPHDSEFHDQLLAAGVSEHELKTDPLETPDASPSEAIEDILESYARKS